MVVRSRILVSESTRPGVSVFEPASVVSESQFPNPCVQFPNPRLQFPNPVFQFLNLFVWFPNPGFRIRAF